jgi:transcriptional regulator with XRE-family HTH domain
MKRRQDLDHEFGAAFGEVFKARRLGADLTQATVARAARMVGLDWKAITVTQLERGQRHWNPVEVLFAALVLELAGIAGGSEGSSPPPTLPDLLAAMGQPWSHLAPLATGSPVEFDIDLDDAAIQAVKATGSFTLNDLFPEHVDRVAPVARPGDLTDREVAAARVDAADETTTKIAARLRATPKEVAYAAQRRWGHGVTNERDRRVAERDGLAPRQVQAVRGHVTRALVDELRNELRQSGQLG